MTNHVHNQAQQRRVARLQAERHTRRSMLRLLACTSMLRSVFTVILPVCGTASWWAVPCLLLPGYIVALLLNLMMNRCHTKTLQQMFSHLMGRNAARCLSVFLSLAVIIDALLSLRTLTSLFTEVIGTDGTHFTLAVITCGMVTLCLHHDGLPRGIHLLRWPILLILTILCIDWLKQTSTDHFSPLLGDGIPAVQDALHAGLSMSWSIPLLLTEPPVNEKSSHAAELLWPIGFVSGFTILIIAAFPHTILTAATGTSQALMTPWLLLHGSNRTLGICLLMLTLFLLLAAEVRSTANLIEAGLEKPTYWLPYGLTGFLSLGNAVRAHSFWQALQSIQRFLLIPFVIVVILCASSFFFCRRRHSF